MLTAVRFDENKDEELINFITNFKDNKNRKNKSEAIRYLMHLGLQLLNNTNDYEFPKINTTKTYHEQSKDIDIDSLKKELRTEIMEEITNPILSNLTNMIDKLGNIQPTYIQPNNNKQNNTSITNEKIDNLPKPNAQKQKEIKIPDNSNELLANILNNVNK